MKTRTIVFVSKGRAEQREIDLPEMGADEILVRAHSSGVSVGTEYWALMDQFTWNKGGTPFPCVPGYQRAGWVQAVGANVTGFQVGQRVAATVGRLEGAPISCGAAHSHYGIHTREQVFPLPDSVSFATAAQHIVAQVGFNAASRLRLAQDETVLVLGDGCIGQMAAQAVEALGASVVLAGHRVDRLERAVKSGIWEVLNTHDVSWVERFTRDDKPITKVIDTVQNEKFFEYYRHHLPWSSDVVLAGFSPGGFPVDMGELQKREISLLSIAGWSRERCEETIRLMAQGKIQMEPLLTHQAAPDHATAIYNMIQEKACPFLGVNFLWE